MKKLLITMCAAATITAFAETKKAEAEKTKPAEVAQAKAPILWGFANYGFYTGYQLYGSIVNTEPTLQGYAEVNANLPFQVGPMDDLGYLGGGIWNNSDLTGKRNASYRRAFNEFDFNIHWAKTFWFDDAKIWGLTYRTSVVWYYYPHTGAKRAGCGTPTTMDWDHYFELVNPYAIPYVNVVHEYRRSDGDLVQFGVKKPWQITDEFSVCPFIEFVWRNHNYGWCFTNYGYNHDGSIMAPGLATMKLELDATYMFTSWMGVFAKVAYCQNLDDNLRDAAADVRMAGDAYGRWNEFCWGGVGLCFNF